MTTVIKIGDKVTWQRISRIEGCEVLAIKDRDGKPVVTLLTPIGYADAWVDDCTLEDKPETTTILSGG